MKKTVEIVGIGHRSGEKDNGIKYDFYQLHGVYDDSNTEGKACVSVIVPDSEISGFKVGDIVQLHTHYYKSKEYYDACFLVVNA